MTTVTVEQFAESLGVPVEGLLVQLQAAGIEAADAQVSITDDEKMVLLTYLRKVNGQTKQDPAADKAAEIQELNRWAAEFLGQGSQALIDSAVSTSWFTESMNMANLVLARVRDEGLEIAVESDGTIGRVTADERIFEGSLNELPANVIRACMQSYNELIELERLAELQALDRWAAEFIGEDDIDSAVEAQWYTTSPGAAFVVLTKAAFEGFKVSVSLDGERAQVTCGNATEEGASSDLGELIVRACCRGLNGD